MKLSTLGRFAMVVAPTTAVIVAWALVPNALSSPPRSAPWVASAAQDPVPQPYDPSLHTSVSDCSTPKTDVVVEENPIASTTNQSPVSPTTVLGMTKTVKVGGTTAGCAVVNVTATAHAGTPSDQPFDVLYLSVWMDGHVGHPAEYQFSSGDGQTAAAHGANFVFKTVRPGTHTFSLKMWTAFGSPSGLQVPTMEILHQ
jgi:hypothetical protein